MSNTGYFNATAQLPQRGKMSLTLGFSRGIAAPQIYPSPNGALQKCGSYAPLGLVGGGKRNPRLKPGVRDISSFQDDPYRTVRGLGLCLFCLFVAALLACTTLTAAERTERIRELFVPEQYFGELFENNTGLVMLSREEYESLAQEARQIRQAAEAEARNVQKPAPVDFVWTRGNYRITVSGERAMIEGELELELFQEGLTAIPLLTKSVALRGAMLNDQPARIASVSTGDTNMLTLFAKGKGRHTLKLQMTTALTVDSTQQELLFRVPRIPQIKLSLEVPGDVSMKSGAAVITRTVEGEGLNRKSRFELFDMNEDFHWVLTLNSLRTRATRTVLARSVQFAELTEMYERLHVTMSLDALHQAISQAQFVVSAGFEVTDIQSPVLARWAMDTETQTLTVDFREPVTGQCRLEISAIRTLPAGETTVGQWTFPLLKALDVASETAVVGLLTEQRFGIGEVRLQRLIPIEASTLTGAIPASAMEPAPGAPSLRFVAAWYAPQSDWKLTGRMIRHNAEFDTTTNLMLMLQEQRQTVTGTMTIFPRGDKLFSATIEVPENWFITGVFAMDNQPIPFERREIDGKTVAQLRFPSGLAPHSPYTFYFVASGSIDGWDKWKTGDIAFDYPIFRVTGATRETGTVTVVADEDMLLIPNEITRLIPLENATSARDARQGTYFAYRFLSGDYALNLTVTRAEPRMRARTYSCYRMEPALLSVYYELAFQVDEARVETLSFLLPAEVSDRPIIRGLGSLRIKETNNELVEIDGTNLRRWTVQLAEPMRGDLRLSVQLEEPIIEDDRKSEERKPVGDVLEESLGVATGGLALSLPIITAENVAWQTALISIEGHEELDIQIPGEQGLRPVDVGELSSSAYMPGRRLLGVYSRSSIGEPLSVEMSRNAVFAITPSIVRLASGLATIGEDGRILYQIDYTLKTNAAFIRIDLQENEQLWSVSLDGTVIRPQRSEASVLVDVPARNDTTERHLQIVFSEREPQRNVRTGAFAYHTQVRMPALMIPGEASLQKIPVAQTVWHLHAPMGHRITETAIRETPRPALLDFVTGLAGVMSGFHLPTGYSGSYLAIGRSRGEPAASRAWSDMDVHYLSDRPQYFARSLEFNFHFPAVAQPEALQEGERFDRGDAFLSGHAVSGFFANDAITAPEMPQEVLRSARTGGLEVTHPLPGREMLASEPAPLPPTPRQPQLDDTLGVVVHELDYSFRREGHDRFFRPGGIAQWSRPIIDPTGQLQPVHRPQILRLESVQPVAVNLVSINSRERMTIDSVGNGLATVQVRVVNAKWLDIAAWTTFFAFIGAGVLMLRQSGRCKARFLFLTILVGTVLVLIPGIELFGEVINSAVWAVLAVVLPVYLLVAFGGWSHRQWARCVKVGNLSPKGCVGDNRLEPGDVSGVPVRSTARCRSAVGNLPNWFTRKRIIIVSIIVVAMLCVFAFRAAVLGQDAPITVRLIQPDDAKIVIPPDVILVPYDSNEFQMGELPRSPEQRIFVSSSKYKELWELVHSPEKKKDTPLAPVPYALAGAEYRATLLAGTSASALQEYLQIEGTIRFEVFTDAPVAVPFPVSGGVLESVALNGKRAELGFSGNLVDGGVHPTQRVMANPMQSAMIAQNLYQAPEAEMGQAAVYLLSVQGKGEYVLEWKTRYNIRRQGGWRIASGRLPAVAATSVAITMPEAGSELRAGNELDQRKWIARSDNDIVETTLSPSGSFHWQWRSQVTEGVVDHNLTVESDARFEVREDGTRMTWNLDLAFGGGRHETFRLRLPGDYQVAAIDGRNVRGWGPVAMSNEQGDADIPASDKQMIDVEFLQPAGENELVTVVVWRNRESDDATTLAVPAVEVIGAAMHRGRITVMQSPLLNVRAMPETGIERTDLPTAVQLANITVERLASAESPLGIRPVQAFRFSSESFRLNLEVSPLAPIHHANIQSIVRMSEHETTLESNIILRLENKPIYQVEILLPQGFKVRRVSVPIQHEYITHTLEEQLILSIYLPEGSGNNLQMIVEGELPEHSVPDQSGIALPKLSVQGIPAERATTTYVVLTDPAFDVRASELVGVENVPAANQTWVQAAQRPLARVALRANYTLDFNAMLSLTTLQPDVTVSTITNTSVGRQSIEDTILISYTIERAGIRRVEFELPGWLKDARIATPLLQRRTVTALDNANGNGGNVLVRIDLQEEVMGDLQVLVRSDRPLVDGTLTNEAQHPVAIPVMRTGRVQRQYVVLENRQGLDEITSVPTGMRLLTRGQPDWAHIESILGANPGTAYIVEERERANASLNFSTRRREALQMAGANIGLSETRLVVGEDGSYIAEQVYHVDNKTEQYLDLRLPTGAELWVVRILTAAEWRQRERTRNVDIGEPVKPVRHPDDAFVRIPLVRSEPGDPDYVLRLVYAGTLPPVRSFSRIEFPLIAVEQNIHVESSIVRLHLPRGFRYTFDGTLNLVEQQQAEREVIQVRETYERGQITRLEFSANQAVNTFEQERAFTNLGMIQNVPPGGVGRGGGTISVTPGGTIGTTATIGSGGAIYRDRFSMPAAGDARGIAIFNEGNMARQFDNQANVFARGNISNTVSNWDHPASVVPAQTVTQGKPAFDNQWIVSNQLVVDDPSNEEFAMDNRRFEPTQQQQQGQEAGSGQQLQLLGRGFPSVQRPAASEVTTPAAPARVDVAPMMPMLPPATAMPGMQPGGGAWGDGMGGMGGMGMGGGMMGGGFGGGGDPARVSMSDMSTHVESLGVQPAPEVSDFLFGGRYVGRAPQPQEPSVSEDMDQSLVFDREESIVAFSPLATRFASLDIDIPVDGQEFVFTSPRGAVELSARSYAESDITRLRYLGLSLLILILVIVVGVSLKPTRRLKAAGSSVG